MSSQIPPSSLPPTFQENGEPAHFLSWMEGQLSELLSTPKPGLKNTRANWLTMAANLLHIPALAPPGVLPWNAMHEQIKFNEVGLALLYNAALRVPSLLAGDPVLAQALFSMICALCCILDLWVDADVPPEEGYLGPSELYTRAASIGAALLRGLGDEVLPEAGPQAREIVRELVNRCLSIIGELLSISEDPDMPMELEICSTPEVAARLKAASKVSGNLG
ncbi:hypothetical protein C8Q70DRAFT_972004 [Cubamyces menziesii]|nr:hypothetical protein C8Q70DRAFT_972004 [Cubamyces menziesii]